MSESDFKNATASSITSFNDAKNGAEPKSFMADPTGP